jgi:hypothetical protein
VRHVFSHNWADCLPERPHGRCLVGWRLPIRPMWQISNSPPVRRTPVGFGRRQPSTCHGQLRVGATGVGNSTSAGSFPRPRTGHLAALHRVYRNVFSHMPNSKVADIAPVQDDPCPGRSIRAADYKATITVARLKGLELRRAIPRRTRVVAAAPDDHSALLSVCGRGAAHRLDQHGRALISNCCSTPRSTRQQPEISGFLREGS